MKRREADYLAYIRESIERVERWTARGREAVLADEVLFEAVLHRLETLADAVAYLPDSLKQRASRDSLAVDHGLPEPARTWLPRRQTRARVGCYRRASARAQVRC